MKHSQPQTPYDILPKDFELRRNARLRERAESIALLSVMAAFWAIVLILNFFVGQYSTPFIK